ncbi:MAG: hypothetical protein AAF709_06765 [Pseudomonadota bacterium]
MPRSSSSHTKPSEAEPKIVSKEDADLIAASLGLPVKIRPIVSEYITVLSADIVEAVSHGDHDLRALERRNRDQIREIAENTSTLMKSLITAEAAVVNPLVAQQLGALLSTDAFRLAAGFRFSGEVSIHDFKHPRFHNPADSYEELEEIVRSERQLAAKPHGIKALTILLKRLRANLVEKEQSLTKALSSRPPEPIRRYTMRRLVELHNMICSEQHQWAKYKFTELVELVLDAMGQPTTGVGSAVDRLLYPRSHRTP